MEIVGSSLGGEEAQIHTIDVWFSKRRNAWVVERLDADGHLVGAAHYCDHEHDAADCLAHWLRTHGDTQLVSPRTEQRCEAEAATADHRRDAA